MNQYAKNRRNKEYTSNMRNIPVSELYSNNHNLGHSQDLMFPN